RAEKTVRAKAEQPAADDRRACGQRGGREQSDPDRGSSQKGSDRERSFLPNGSDLSGVSEGKGPMLGGVSGSNPAETPPQTPPPNVCAGREPKNPRTQDPPQPPEGGSAADSILVEQTFVTDRGRTRRRLIPVDLNKIRRS